MHCSTPCDRAPAGFIACKGAIRGTTAVDRLSCPAPAGCVRLARENPERLFALVQAMGPAGTEMAIDT